MKKTFFAGALALAALGLLSATSSASAGEWGGAAAAAHAPATIDIGRIKRGLHLTREQAVYWPPVEAALRALTREQADAEPSGMVHRIGHRVVSAAYEANSIRRLMIAARPLIAVLRDDQKQEALAMAEEMGLGPVLEAMN